jgi:hypothetical protein
MEVKKVNSWMWALLWAGVYCVWAELFDSNVGKTTLGRTFYVEIGRTACDACSSTWNLGTYSAFSLTPRKSMDNLAQICRLQDLPNANWLLASSSAWNTRTLMLVPVWLFPYSEKNYILGSQSLFHMHNLDEQQTPLWHVKKYTSIRT